MSPYHALLLSSAFLYLSCTTQGPHVYFPASCSLFAWSFIVLTFEVSCSFFSVNSYLMPKLFPLLPRFPFGWFFFFFLLLTALLRNDTIFLRATEFLSTLKLITQLYNLPCSRSRPIAAINLSQVVPISQMHT